MAKKELSESEKIAFAIFEHMGVTLEPNDNESGDGRYDFKIIENEEHVGALEVTEACKENSKKYLAEVFKKADSPKFKLIQAKRSWRIRLFKILHQLKFFLQNIENELVQFEKLGITNFSTRDNNTYTLLANKYSGKEFEKYRDITLAMRKKYGEIKGSSFEPIKGTAKLLITEVSSFWSNSESLTAVVQHEANKIDNRTKLGKADKKRRELFILIDSNSICEDAESDCNKAYDAIRNNELPKSFPQLPQEITGVWVAARLPSGSKDVNHFAVCRFCSSSLQWQKLEPIEVPRLD